MINEYQDDVLAAIKRTSEVYDRKAREYQATTELFHSELIYPKIVSIANGLFGSLNGKSFLDLGCGAGSLLSLLRNLGSFTVGLDISLSSLRLAKTRESRVIKASMHCLPFLNETFDAAVSNYALNYLPPDGQALALQEAFRVLRHGGIVIFSYMHPHLMRSVGGSNQWSGNYFEPTRELRLTILGEEFILYLLDWPEIINLVLGAGFFLIDLIDAEIPTNLDRLIFSIKDEVAISLVKSFCHSPYGIFVVAQKP